MKYKLLSLLLLTLVSLPLHARLEKGDIGVGGELGSVIDANVNWYLSNDRTIEGILSISDKWILVGGGLRTYWLDLLDYDHDLFLTYTFRGYLYSNSSDRNPFHARDNDFKDTIGFATVAALGASFLPSGIPVEGYSDIGLGLSITPKTEMFPSWEVGFRFYF